jgi:hypothetical protein
MKTIERVSAQVAVLLTTLLLPVASAAQSQTVDSTILLPAAG